MHRSTAMRQPACAISLLLVMGLFGADVTYAQQRNGGCSVLPADNIWNAPVDQLPVLSNSSSMVTTIGAGAGFHADFGSGTWDGGPIGIPFVTVPGTQTKYPAAFQRDSPEQHEHVSDLESEWHHRWQ